MSTEIYMRQKIERERKLGLLLDKIINNIKINAQEQTFLLENGFNRFINHGSCFFKNYKDICRQINKEDIRMLTVVKKFTTTGGSS